MLVESQHKERLGFCDQEWQIFNRLGETSMFDKDLMTCMKLNRRGRRDDIDLTGSNFSRISF
jgi:hypothetical protein